MKKTIISTLAASLIASAAFAVVETVDTNGNGFLDITDPIDVTDPSLVPAAIAGQLPTVALNDPNNTGLDYLLTEIVFASDVKVEIPAGTVIRGVEGQLDANNNVLVEPGTLVITRSAEIEAIGNPGNPIIFTYEFDNADPFANPTAPLDANGDLVTGLWGGVILLGNAPSNNDESGSNALLVPGTDFIEGLPSPNPADANPDLRGVFGGQDCNDSSGIMQYVSIRHGGFNLSPANEINGLTMGGVGAGTVLQFIEVYCGQDDGFEWFGGTVSSKNLLSAYNNDDAFDYDQGFCGFGQFWAVVMADNNNDGDKGGEFDGDDQAGAEPFAVPVIYNMTVIGSTGLGVRAGNGGGQIDYDADAGGSLFNSIIVESGIPSLDINPTSTPKLADGLLKIRHNIFYRNVENFAAEAVADHDQGDADQVLPGGAFDGDNLLENPFIGGLDFAELSDGPGGFSRDSVVYFTPFNGGIANTTTLEPYTIGSFFTGVGYKGAFDPASAEWTDTWTAGFVLGIFQ